MFAVIAAVLIFLAAVGVNADAVDLFLLGLAFLALHFAWDFSPWRR
jgi:hypothetical protein